MNIDKVEETIINRIDLLYHTEDMLINVTHRSIAIPFSLTALVHEKIDKYSNLLSWIQSNKSWAEKCWNVYATDNQLDSVYDIDDDYLFLFLELYGNTKEHT